MDKWGKVIKGLECCSVGADRDPTWDNLTARNCGKCPYSKPGIACTRALTYDALELLKAQEPRILTIEEITGDGECWFEGINGACGYADCYMWTGSKEVEVNRISMKPEYVSWDDFKKNWRCWTSRPTDEQRKAVKWE